MAMSPFCKIWHFQNEVTKRDKKGKKVTKSDIRPFQLLPGTAPVICERVTNSALG